MFRLLFSLLAVSSLASCAAAAPVEKNAGVLDSKLTYEEQVKSLSVTDKMRLIRGTARLWEEGFTSESGQLLFDCYTLYNSEPSIAVKVGEKLYGDDFFSQAAAFGVRRKVFDNAYWVKTGNDIRGLYPSHGQGPIATVMEYAKLNETRDVTELEISREVVSSAIENCGDVAEMHRMSVRDEYTTEQMIEADQS